MVLIILNVVLFFSCIHQEKNVTEKATSKIKLDTVIISKESYDVLSIKDGKKHGIMRRYFHGNSGYTEERLYVNDSIMVLNTIFIEDTCVGINYLNRKNDSLLYKGSKAYDFDTYEKKQKRFTYHETSASDTIKYGEDYEIEIRGNMGLIEDFDLLLELGEIKTNFELTDTIKVLRSDSTILRFKLTPDEYMEGINLLTGKLHYKIGEKDLYDFYDKIITLKEPFLFYKQFVVLPKEEIERKKD